ncbi:hypothetical protein M9H77_15813 [Catharanthus roseus]|uniref:Uncharacterized protein n=1 Tax=Catharanthus roseus TaxID=4058 RepID=A0ACC0B033_CATRO|nr:hypothetical protein M9H77_15813 [Catharanthus roseus]
MENNNDQQPAAASSEQVSSPDQSQQQTHVVIRSYECNFCKKGFSNAQALGGHMNIHRKDKAKLKQASKETKKSIKADITSTMPPLDAKAKSIPNWPCFYSSSSHHQSSYKYYPSSLRRDHHELKQLPLFVETAAASRNNIIDHHVSSNNSAEWEEEEERGGGCFGAEIDLELRLGHELYYATTTRKFF